MGSSQKHHGAWSFSDAEWQRYQLQLLEEEEEIEKVAAASERRLRLRKTVSRGISLKPTKFGRCLRCKHALRPKVWQSGKNAGWAALLCSKWWHRLSGGKRACWYFKPATSQDLQTFPRSTLDVYFSLRMRLLRRGAERPQ